jgi:hypothetical protein
MIVGFTRPSQERYLFRFSFLYGSDRRPLVMTKREGTPPNVVRRRSQVFQPAACRQDKPEHCQKGNSMKQSMFVAGIALAAAVWLAQAGPTAPKQVSRPLHIVGHMMVTLYSDGTYYYTEGGQATHLGLYSNYGEGTYVIVDGNLAFLTGRGTVTTADGSTLDWTLDDPATLRVKVWGGTGRFDENTTGSFAVNPTGTDPATGELTYEGNGELTF